MCEKWVGAEEVEMIVRGKRKGGEDQRVGNESKGGAVRVGVATKKRKE